MVIKIALPKPKNNHRISFTQAKNKFDEEQKNRQFIKKSLVPVDGKVIENIRIRNEKNEVLEEYYKWQFIYSIIYSGLYSKDYIGVEIYLPKGSKSSAPIIVDGCIFNESSWLDYYQKWRQKNDQESLDWLRKHLIGVIEFKREDSKNIEIVYNQQLKPALKESEAEFCLGILYDAERLHLFQKKENYFLRLDESYNLKEEKSTTKELSLHLTDAYYKIPSFEQIKRRAVIIKLDRSKRTIDDLEIITGIYSKRLKDGISNILRVMDKVGMKNQRGYEILIQLIALKIYDEKRSVRIKSYLDFYKTDEETIKLNLLFYVTEKEKSYSSLSDDDIQNFISRMRTLYNKASEEYHHILKREDTETIAWNKESHVNIMSEVVEQFQDYSFVKSHKTDLYQVVFYKFANEFSKAEKGQFVTPIPLIDFLVQIVNPRGDETVIDPTSGIADFLSISYVDSNSKLDDNNIYGVDNDEQMVMLAQLNMLLNGDGNAILRYKPDKGSITWKFDTWDNLVELDPKIHKNGNWDNWKDQTKLKKFSVVLTNPPFGEDRKIKPKTQRDKDIFEMYELWNTARCRDWIDPGLIFLENAYRILKENGRVGIVLSNSIAAISRWREARKWLTNKMRIVALFDLPANVFADTGVNTTLIVAYKPNRDELKRLKEQNYSVFVKQINRVGYEIRTSRRVKFYNPIYRINEQTFEVEQDEEGNPLLDEEFTATIQEFRAWCLGQEEKLQELFIRSR